MPTVIAMYSLARKLLFALDPEVSHELSLDLIGAGERTRLMRPFMSAPTTDRREVMGISFPNAVGLAAGLDKNGDYFNGLGQIGFGFIEIGTVTPKPQAGNPKPRLFRLQQDEAIINRMGFNNKGVDHLVAQVKKRRYEGVLGINIGKNKDTPEESALDDYLICMRKVYEFADYITVNISSPNTPGLRNLQHGDNFKQLLKGLKDEQKIQQDLFNRYVPIAIKVAPDNSDEQIEEISSALLEAKVDAIIVGNTTLSRDALKDREQAEEAGGLSGRPLTDRSTECITKFRKALGATMPIIGVGGIFSAEDALAKVDAGANLVQVYTGFIFKGPSLVKEVAEALAE